jgi:hypothetical protein
MALKRLILHLGTPKTGTTSLQNTLVAEEEKLATLGVRYLKSYRAAINHNRLIMQLSKGGETAETITRKLRRELDQSEEPTILISTEIAYGLKATTLLLDSIGVKHLGTAEIMIYVRRQDLLLEAMAKQKLKSGHYKGSLEKFIAARKRVGKYMSYISDVQQRFPSLVITCRPYDQRELIGGDVIADFWQFLDLPYLPQQTPAGGSANMTPCRELAIALSLQEFVTPQHRRKVIVDIQRSRPDLFKSKDILDASARRAFQEEFREENKALGTFCGRDIEALFNDDVDYAAESNPIKNPEEREALFELAEDTVRETAQRLHPNPPQEVNAHQGGPHKSSEEQAVE